MPVNSSQQTTRREAIVRILSNESITRQSELVDLLKERGLTATQSSVSRDLRELGVAKVGERYLPPPTPNTASVKGFEKVAQFGWVREVRPAGPHLTVILTAIGAAQSVAVAIDQAHWPEIVGCLSGDDTVFVATATVRQQQQVMRRLQQIFRT